ncbi:hypothetical protein RB598_004638 [Gaeumannomyces tritici]
MEDLSRSEYPAMLAHLQPSQATQALVDRVKRINKINNEVADWLQERHRVEEQYVAGLRKLMTFKVPNGASELGVFQVPWDKVIQSVEAIASSHQMYAMRVAKDVEQPLRSFHTRKEVAGMQTFVSNLQGMAKELDDAQHAADKQNKKAGKVSAQKLDAANSRLENASQQWEAQAPFIFESLQALDEQRTNHLRDVLTQLQTHEVDQASRTQASAEEALNLTLEISTATEIESFAQRTTSGKPKLEKRAATPARLSSSAAGSMIRPQSSAGFGHEDNTPSEHSGDRIETVHTESKLRSRIGTMLGRRRQSIHGGFGQLSPQKNSGPFSRGLSSSHGQRLSPGASMYNLSDTNRLSSLVESPNSPTVPDVPPLPEVKANGVTPTGSSEKPAEEGAAATENKPATLTNGEVDDIFGAAPGQPSGQTAGNEGVAQGSKDSEGYTVPAAMNDPISQAQKEAAASSDEPDQFFTLKIQNEPVAEEDADAQKAAISSVTNTLSASMPSRRGGTVRGRRDVRNTIYMPMPTQAPLEPIQSPTENTIPPPPAVPAHIPNKPSTSATLTTEASIAATSDTQSVRSATSLGSLAHTKHPDMTAQGLNSSIIETVSASFEDGEIKSVKINGEIAVSYNNSSDFASRHIETVRINNFPLLDVIGPNRIFVSNTGHADEFTLDTSHLAKTSTAFTYRLHSEADNDTALASLCPLILKPVWKPTANKKLGLLLQYRLNPATLPASAEETDVAPLPLTLHNLVFVVTYEGKASAAQTKPAGTHLRDKHLVYWRLGDVTLPAPASGSDGEWSKIVCRIVGAEGAEVQPGHIEARWEYTPQQGGSARVSISRLLEDKGKGKAVEESEAEADPFSDDNPVSPRVEERRWEAVPLVSKIVSGRYEAK